MDDKINTLFVVMNPRVNGGEQAVLWGKIKSLIWNDYSFNRNTGIDGELNSISYQNFSDTGYYLHHEYVAKTLSLQEFIDLIKTL